MGLFLEDFRNDYHYNTLDHLPPKRPSNSALHAINAGGCAVVGDRRAAVADDDRVGG